MIKDKILSIYYTLTSQFRDTYFHCKLFCKNVWRQRKALYNAWSFNGDAGLMYLKYHLIETKKRLENGYEEEISRNKKLQNIERAIELLENVERDDFTERCGYRDDMTEHTWVKIEGTDTSELVVHYKGITSEEVTEIFAKARELEQQEWGELRDLLFGETKDDFMEGRDIRSWWD